MSLLNPDLPALAFAPMDGVTDAPMRTLQGSVGAFSYAVSEFLRVSGEPIPPKVFRREVPELSSGGLTPTGLPVQIQILGGDAERMAWSALAACKAGALGIDINFGCPAPTVNRHDGGASLLRHPCRIREIVAEVRSAVPAGIPVSAKLRLGWDDIHDIEQNAVMAAEGGASWLTIHARTRTQGYTPPVYWPKVGHVRRNLGLPVVANGDIWNFEDFLRCRDETGCLHFMIGRGALANPMLSHQIAAALGLKPANTIETDWATLFRTLADLIGSPDDRPNSHALMRLKQWIRIAHQFGSFPYFHELKQTTTVREFFEKLEAARDGTLRYLIA